MTALILLWLVQVSNSFANFANKTCLDFEMMSHLNQSIYTCINDIFINKERFVFICIFGYGEAWKIKMTKVLPLKVFSITSNA